MIHIDKQEGNVIEVTVDGKLLHEDYLQVLPVFERIIDEHGVLRCLIEIRHITGMQPRAMLDDLKFDIKHARQIERCAVVSDVSWHAWMTKLWGVFMPRCEVRAFQSEDRSLAATWVRE